MSIYLDYNATTPVDKEVVGAMRPYLEDYFGNPSSIHSYGTETKKAVENARRQVAGLINCKPEEIIFTSGGTESNNHAIKGYAFANEKKGRHIITSAIEHPAVIEVCRYLESKGFHVTYLPVDQYGLVKPDEIEAAITSQTILITIMHANNEIGTIQPIKEIAHIAHRHGIVLHSDAAQSVGKYPVDVNDLGTDMLSIAGHKLYGPKGIGVLYIREGLILEKLIHGADHEYNRRAGTENVPEIVGLGLACEIAGRDSSETISKIQRLRDLLYEHLIKSIPDIRLNGHPELRLPNTLNVSFRQLDANTILNHLEMKGVAASAGAACHTDTIEVSPVLTAIGLDTDTAMGTIRFSLGKYNTEEEIIKAAGIITEIVNSLRKSEEADNTKTDLSVKDIRLTHYAHGLGCACKLRPQTLETILQDLPVSTDPNILIDSRNSDDSAVYRINDSTAVVQTLDFFAPIVDDPYFFGAIAAANALSDIYAMGASPVFALNIVGFPTAKLPLEVLKAILKGASDKAAEAGITILGGHSIDDPEPKYGMVVTGIVDPRKIWANSGAKENDAIIITKALGTGILTTAMKRGVLNETAKKQLIDSMTELNKKAAEILKGYTVNACTDVTGFGLTGHLSEITLASGINVELFADKVPLLDQTAALVAANIVPGGTKNNLAHYSRYVRWDNKISDIRKIILCDAQTSGGLLFTVPENEKDAIITDLNAAGISQATHIGYCLGKRKGDILVRNA
ncbi:MAG TPA: selenide, water dikinase SelD [Bacteroidales bacterium]|nr:selenide, water dikinase SelD [Bacteroidales bacterium]HPI68259.1 selenide, water dikinase SelD [Bacteroidales bacterium]HPR73338.1 selenide, water dikinase SelD [Bacteroidales bacterium]